MKIIQLLALASATGIGVSTIVEPATAMGLYGLRAAPEPLEVAIEADRLRGTADPCAPPLDLPACVDWLMESRILLRHGRDHEKNDVAGAVVSIAENDKVLFTRGYGCANADKQQAVEAGEDAGEKETLFRVGSVSKLVTATALMQLVERLAEARGTSLEAVLQTDVNEFLKGSAVKIPPLTAESPAPITLKNLLTHTAGFEENQGGYILSRTFGEELLEQVLAEHTPARVRPPAASYDQGFAASYSAWAMALVGHIVARESGKPAGPYSFDEYVEESIFKPLGMADSTFREFPEGQWPANWNGRIASGHEYSANSGDAPGEQLRSAISCPPHQNGKFQPQPFEFLHALAPSTGLTTTASDMARFMIAQLRNEDDKYQGPRILDSATARLMHQRMLTPNAHGDFNGAALGFYEINRRGRRIISHSGNTVWFNSKFALVPEKNLGIFLAVNSPVSDVVLRNFINRFLDCYLDRCVSKTVVEPPKDLGRISQYAGVYYPNAHSYTRNEKFLLFTLPAAPIVVSQAQDQMLRITNLPLFQPDSLWEQVKPGVFLHVSPGGHRQELVAFEDKDGTAQLLGIMPFSPAYKARWYETPDFHRALHKLSYLGFLTALLVVLLKPKPGASPQQRYARWLAAVIAVMGPAALLMLFEFFSDAQAVLYGYTAAVYLVLTLLLILVPLVTAAVYFAIKAWLLNWWTVLGRLQYSFFTLAALAFMWSMHYWNLIGYKPS